MKLEFENSRYERKVIGNPNTVREALQMIDSFLKNYPYFKRYYTRINTGETEWTIDVGSHSEFFYLSNLTTDAEAEYKCLLAGNEADDGE